MPRLTEQEQQEIIHYLEANKPLPDKFRRRSHVPQIEGFYKF